MTVEDFEAAMRVHFWGPLYATLAALPHLRRQETARIVNISSIGGRIAVPHLAPYSASKFALAGLSDGLRAELAREKIYVTTVLPGADAHRLARQRPVQGEAGRGVRLVRGRRLPAARLDGRPAGRPPHPRGLPLRRADASP